MARCSLAAEVLKPVISTLTPYSITLQEPDKQLFKFFIEALSNISVSGEQCIKLLCLLVGFRC